jgi:hypothetical protein
MHKEKSATEAIEARVVKISMHVDRHAHRPEVHSTVTSPRLKHPP